MTEPRSGHVYLVGAGPGDPDLITVRGQRLLAGADAVVHDFMVHPDLLARARADAEVFCVGKQAGRHTMEQDHINALLVNLGRAGKSVCRLKGGDPYVFGRGGEEALALVQAGIPFEVVPGVTSAVAAPAAAGIPVTHRGLARAFHVITGHAPAAGQAPPVLPGPGEGTLVFLMGLGRMGLLADQLAERGWPADTPAAAVSKGTLPDQRVVTGTVSDIAARVRDAGLVSPAILVVGDVVALHPLLSGSGHPVPGASEDI